MLKAHMTVSILSLLLMVTICWAKSSKVETIKNVDLDRFTGTWYEISRMPNKHEKGMVEVTSTLKRTGKDRFVLITSGYKGSKGGKKTTVRATVEVPDRNNTGNLKVKVFLFSYDFKILDVDQKNYNYALVTSDEGKHLWIYSKTPVMDPQVYQKMINSAKQKGFDVASLEQVSQTSNSAYVKK